METAGSSPNSKEPATFPYSEPDKSSPCPYPTYWRSILIWSSHRLGLPCGFFHLDFPTKIIHAPLLFPIRATHPANLILLDFITRIIFGDEWRSLISSLRILLHSPVTSYILGPNMILNILFSNTLSQSSSLNVSDQVSYSYKIGKAFSMYLWYKSKVNSN